MIKDAQHLQDKTFMSFEKIDEYSQRYSEDVEAGTEIAKQVFNAGFNIASTVGLFGFGYLALTGKLPIHRIIKSISTLVLNKKSSIRTTINKAYSVLSKDKALKKDFCNALVNKEAGARIMQNEQLAPLFSQLENIVTPIIKQPAEFSKHFRQGFIATWARNLTKDILKIFGRKTAVNQINKLKTGVMLDNALTGAQKAQQKLQLTEIANTIKEENSFLKYKNYKTLYNTAIAGFAPIMAALIGIPYAFNAWLTNIQKKAGKIGIMKATKELERPELYVNQHQTTEKDKQNKTIA